MNEVKTSEIQSWKESLISSLELKVVTAYNIYHCFQVNKNRGIGKICLLCPLSLISYSPLGLLECKRFENGKNNIYREYQKTMIKRVISWKSLTEVLRSQIQSF